MRQGFHRELLTKGPSYIPGKFRKKKLAKGLTFAQIETIKNAYERERQIEIRKAYLNELAATY